jgi:hypothetical protein
MQNTNIAVVIPWRAKKDRQYAFNVVTSWYKNNLPDAKLFFSDDGKKDFCLSGCRNVGVKNAEESGANVVIINDADTIPEIDPLMSAITQASQDDYVHLPYTEYRALGFQGTKEFKRGKELKKCDAFIVNGAVSGVYVASPKTWWSHYGQDERFRGWGFEDAAWYKAHTVILGQEPVRHEGKLYALNHISANKEGPLFESNKNLCDAYLSIWDKESMQNLAKEGLFLE